VGLLPARLDPVQPIGLAAASRRRRRRPDMRHVERRSVTETNATLAQLADELADVVIAADLLAMACGIDLEEATREKFNRDTDRLGLQTKIGK
jgi:NTP pyrophosphatase (non-canonical NTP hydrolase)